MKKYLCLGLFIFLFTSIAGCQAKAESSEITVAAAASLSDAFKEIAAQFSKDYPGSVVKFSFGASGALQTQIEQGAPVDVFASAGKKETDVLYSKGLVSKPRTFASNELVLIVPSGNPLHITGFQDLTRHPVKTLAIADPSSVPAGQYAAQTLNFYRLSLKEKYVLATDVRQVLQWVASGNAQAGFVYQTDALNNRQVTVVSAAPTGSHDEIAYTVAVVKNGEKAVNWTDYLLGSKAQSILGKYGFKTRVNYE